MSLWCLSDLMAPDYSTKHLPSAYCSFTFCLHFPSLLSALFSSSPILQPISFSRVSLPDRANPIVDLTCVCLWLPLSVTTAPRYLIHHALFLSLTIQTYNLALLERLDNNTIKRPHFRRGHLNSYCSRDTTASSRLRAGLEPQPT